MNAAIVTFSDRGYALGERLTSYFEQSGETASLTRCVHGRLKEWVKEHFKHDALIFIGSCGIAVRAVAPFLTSKTSDPAVVVIDEIASCAVSLLSGHIGGANELTSRLACFLGAMPVITTATDVNGVFAIDTWAVKHGLRIANPDRIKWVSAHLLAGGSIKIECDYPVRGQLPQGIVLCDKGGDVLITHRMCGCKEALRLVPPIITLGIGCKKDVNSGTIECAFELALEKAGCHPLAVARVCSIDLKAREPGILAFCHRHALPFKTFLAQELMAAPGTYTSSAFVKQITGADNVCERSAVLGSGDGGRLLIGKDAGNGVTMALAISPFTICFDGERKT
ncbi:MAG: cobalamin biosynthesis protein [Oscillospiraceae bacterium]